MKTETIVRMLRFFAAEECRCKGAILPYPDGSMACPHEIARAEIARLEGGRLPRDVSALAVMAANAEKASDFLQPPSAEVRAAARDEVARLILIVRYRTLAPDLADDVVALLRAASAAALWYASPNQPPSEATHLRDQLGEALGALAARAKVAR